MVKTSVNSILGWCFREMLLPDIQRLKLSRVVSLTGMPTIEELRHLRGSEDKIELKAAVRNFDYGGWIS